MLIFVCFCQQIADQQGAIFGQCCFDEGDVKITMGTGTFCSVITHRPCVPGQGEIIVSFKGTICNL